MDIMRSTTVEGRIGTRFTQFEATRWLMYLPTCLKRFKPFSGQLKSETRQRSAF